MTAVASTSCLAAPIGDSHCPTTEQLKRYTGSFPVMGHGDVGLVNGEGGSDFVPEENKWDFDNKIASAQLMRPELGVSVRLMDITSMHLLGTGEWDILYFVSCRKGHLHVVPQDSFLYGVKVHIVSDKEFTTRSGYWMQKDARCCPSKIEFRRYNWNTEPKTFLVTQRSIKAK